MLVNQIRRYVKKNSIPKIDKLNVNSRLNMIWISRLIKGKLHDTIVFKYFGVHGVHLIAPKSVQFPAKCNYGTAGRYLCYQLFCPGLPQPKLQGSTANEAVNILGEQIIPRRPGICHVESSKIIK